MDGFVFFFFLNEEIKKQFGQIRRHTVKIIYECMRLEQVDTIDLNGQMDPVLLTNIWRELVLKISSTYRSLNIQAKGNSRGD